MSARGSLGEELQIPGEANACLRRHIPYRVLGTNLGVPVKPLSNPLPERQLLSSQESFRNTARKIYEH